MSVTFKYYLDGIFLEHPVPIFSLPVGDMASDVGIETLASRGETIPAYPSYQEWCAEVMAMNRCGRCWAKVISKSDLEFHNRSFHNADIHLPDEATRL